MKRFAVLLLFLLLICVSSRAETDLTGMWQLVRGDTDLFALVIHDDMTGEVYQAPDAKADPVYGSLLMSGRFALGKMLTLPNGEMFAFTLEEDGDQTRLLLEKGGHELAYIRVPTLPQLFLSGKEAAFQAEDGRRLTLLPGGTCTLDQEEGTWELGVLTFKDRTFLFQFLPDSGDYLLLEAEGPETGASARFLPVS